MRTLRLVVGLVGVAVLTSCILTLAAVCILEAATGLTGSL